MVFVKPLQADARAVLSRTILDPSYRTGGPKIMLNAEQMQSLPDFFANIEDPRRAQGRRHQLRSVLAIAAGAILWNAWIPGYLGLGQKPRHQGTETFRLPLRKRPLRRAKRVCHPQCSYPRQSRTSGPRFTTLE